MARLIAKEYVTAHEGEVVFLETKYGCELARVLAFGYHEQPDGTETVTSMEFETLDDHDEYDMDSYGIDWRLWDVYVETPSVQEMSREEWADAAR